MLPIPLRHSENSPGPFLKQKKKRGGCWVRQNQASPRLQNKLVFSNSRRLWKLGRGGWLSCFDFQGGQLSQKNGFHSQSRSGHAADLSSLVLPGGPASKDTELCKGHGVRKQGTLRWVQCGGSAQGKPEQPLEGSGGLSPPAAGEMGTVFGNATGQISNVTEAPRAS